MSTSRDDGTRLGEGLLEMADEFAGDAASFAAAVESVAAGSNPGAAVSVLILALSGILSSGAKLGAQEDVAGFAEVPEQDLGGTDLGVRSSTGRLRSALAEQFGGVDEYREVIDPYVGDEVSTAQLSDDLASISGDLLQGLALYTEGRYDEALAWWQYSYLASWGPTASSCLRAVQSLLLLMRVGSPMGAPGEDIPG